MLHNGHTHDTYTQHYTEEHKLSGFSEGPQETTTTIMVVM